MLFFPVYQNASSALVSTLRSERLQWSARLSMLETEHDKVIGDSLLSASFYTYVGGFLFAYRREIVHNDWLQDIQARKIPIDSSFAPLYQNVPGSSLDAAESTIQNSILVTNSVRFPLCIDPYGIASDFIKSKLEHSSENYKILHFNDENFMDELALTVSSGGSIIIDDIDDFIDFSLRDLLEKNIICKCSANPNRG